MTDKKPNTDVGISADAALAALALLGNYVQTSGGQSAVLTATDTQHKTDVNVPELMTSLNGLFLQMSANFQASLNTVNIAAANRTEFYAGLTQQMALDHRDQNHTKQALAATFPFVVAGDAAEESANDTDK